MMHLANTAQVALHAAQVVSLRILPSGGTTHASSHACQLLSPSRATLGTRGVSSQRKYHDQPLLHLTPGRGRITQCQILLYISGLYGGLPL